MKKIIFILLLPLFCLGQTEIRREYYPSGRLLSVIHYTDGVRNGATQYFHDYGAWAIKTSLNYKNGKLISSSKTYSKEGKLIEEGQYKYSDDWVYSRKDGIWKTYYDTGEMKVEITYDEKGNSLKYISYEKDGSISPMPEGGC